MGLIGLLIAGSLFFVLIKFIIVLVIIGFIISLVMRSTNRPRQ